MSRLDYRHAHQRMSTTFHDSAREFSDTAWRTIKPGRARSKKRRDPFWPVLLVCYAILAFAAAAAVWG